MRITLSLFFLILLSSCVSSTSSRNGVPINFNRKFTINGTPMVSELLIDGHSYLWFYFYSGVIHSASCSCHENNGVPKPANQPLNTLSIPINFERNFTINGTSMVYELIIDGHSYLWFSYNGGVVHSSSCSCHSATQKDH